MHSQLNDFTYHKALQKITESHRDDIGDQEYHKKYEKETNLNEIQKEVILCG